MEFLGHSLGVLKHQWSKIFYIMPKIKVLTRKVEPPAQEAVQEAVAAPAVKQAKPVKEKVEPVLAAEQWRLDDQGSIIDLVDSLIKHAHSLRASDIHIDPQHDRVRVRLRIDGVLQDLQHISKTIHPEIISRIKILSGLRTDEHQTAQDGRFRVMASETNAIDIRVSIAPTYHGENAVLRLLADQQQEFSLSSLGFSAVNQEKIQRAIAKPYGMILATGPTGSGKTTTLYTILKILNTPRVSIITIEDPVEYAVSGIEQITVNDRTNLTFSSGLRSILRQDPNIIMVGEIRDRETAGLAVNTALTGHLLLSTLHTSDAATTLPRLIDLKVEPYLIASTVNVVIGQRLVRKICEACKTEYKPSAAELKSIKHLLPKDLDGKQKFYRGEGCSACNHIGYRGRVGIHEVMEIDKELREAILAKKSSAVLKELAIEHGMITMVEDGLEKAAAGITTIEEVLRTLYE